MTRDRNVAPATPFVFAYGTASFNVSTTPTAIPWHDIKFITSDFSISSGDTRIRLKRGVATNGIYMVYAGAGAVKKAGNPLHLTLQIYLNGVLCPCGAAHGAIGSGVTHSDATFIGAYHFKAGDYIEVFINVEAGSATVEDDTARFIISALPMQGWDNNRGSKDRIRGGVSR